MQVVIFAIGLFCAAFAVHLVVWRVALPRHHIGALLGIFFAVLLGGCLITLLPAVQPYGPRSIWDYFAVVLFHSAAALAYTAFYSAIEEDSPSLALVKAVAQAGNEGLSRKDCQGVIGDDFLVQNRFMVMLKSGLIREKDHRYYLSARAEHMVLVFEAAAGLFGLPRGG